MTKNLFQDSGLDTGKGSSASLFEAEPRGISPHAEHGNERKYLPSTSFGKVDLDSDSPLFKGG
ncbi:hypothetical protein IJ00_24720 [Calothrix sp. 336/3]|nr:hypothetical protein IJ00_24720 [Calothrix sp. 336/3]